jgi:hypothetical protein
VRTGTWRPRPEEDDTGFGYCNVVCTDRGRHERTRIARAEVTETAGNMTHQGRHWWPPTPDAAPGSGLSRESLTFRCPRCERVTRVRPDRWWPALRALVGVSVVAELDLSLLPF